MGINRKYLPRLLYALVTSSLALSSASVTVPPGGKQSESIMDIIVDDSLAFTTLHDVLVG